MFGRFLSDERGNFALTTTILIVPLLGALALGVDYTEMSRQRQATLNALDAAGIATARRLIEGASDEDAVAYANDFFEANLGNVVSPDDAKLHVVLPKNNTGGGTLQLSADLTYRPYFLSAFRDLIGTENTKTARFSAVSDVQLKNTLEVALVLDNSGSMDFYGSGSGKKRIDLLKSAAKQLVDTLAAQAGQMKQIAKPVQFGLVPFAASVNVGPQYASASWMDTEGRSPIHHENFDWGAFTASNKKVQLSSGVYRKKGSDWGAEENDIVTRFTLFNDMKRITGQTWVDTGTEKVCDNYFMGICWHWSYRNTGYYQTNYGQFASWQGCVETRPAPYDKNDATPTSSNPATLFVPMFAPDETDNRDNRNRRAMGDYWADATSGTDSKRQGYMPKYWEPAPNGTSAAGNGEGPNASCTTKPITPLNDVTQSQGLNTIKNAIDAMQPNGATNVTEGIGWGWRVVSGGEPFTEGRPDIEKGNDKVLIVLTDGANTYYTPDSLGYNDLAGNKSTYSAYGYTGRGYDGTSTTRMFIGTSNSVGKYDYSNANYTEAMTEQMAAVCENAKANKLIVMTVSLDLSTSDRTEKEQIEALKACASDSRFRKDANDPSKPAKLFWNAAGSNLAEKFKEIADELSNLRIVG